MNAFAIYPTDGNVIKAYFHGDDWQIVHNNGEYWFSVWESSLHNSLVRAIGESCSRLDVTFDYDVLILKEE